MPIDTAIVLFVAGILGGALNAVAGGGSFVAFPALLFTGVPPIPSNATNCFALWVGTTASGGAYRNRLDITRRVLIPLIAISVVGGIAGAILLLKTPAHTFMLMVASKIDAANKDKLAKLKQYCKKKKLQLFPISAVTGEGIEKLKFAMAEKVEELRSTTLQSYMDSQDAQ